MTRRRSSRRARGTAARARAATDLRTRRVRREPLRAVLAGMKKAHPDAKPNEGSCASSRRSMMAQLSTSVDVDTGPIWRLVADSRRPVAEARDVRAGEARAHRDAPGDGEVSDGEKSLTFLDKRPRDVARTFAERRSSSIAGLGSQALALLPCQDLPRHGR